MSKALRTAVVYSLAIVVMIVTINLLTSPGFLWCIFPVFGIAWWPLSVYFSQKRNPLAYALCGAALLIGLFLATYLLTSPGAHPWFLYPALGVVWWPLSVWGAGKDARVMSIAGGLTVIATLLTINLMTSPSFLWFWYPAFFMLWWPLSVLLGKRANTMAFALGSAVAGSLFLLVMHAIQTPAATPWYLFVLLPLFWWPVCRMLAGRVNQWQITLISLVVFAAYYTAIIALLYGVNSLLSVFLLVGATWLTYAMGISKYRSSFLFAAVNAVVIGLYTVLVHHFVTPDYHPWFWYGFFPLLWWPVSAALKNSADKPLPVVTGALLFLGYYGALNLWLSPATPWVLFLTLPAVAAVIAALCRPKQAWTSFSVAMTLAGIAYVSAINLVYTPHALWAVYPAFALLWWPLSMLLLGRKANHEDASN